MSAADAFAAVGPLTDVQGSPFPTETAFLSDAQNVWDAVFAGQLVVLQRAGIAVVRTVEYPHNGFATPAGDANFDYLSLSGHATKAQAGLFAVVPDLLAALTRTVRGAEVIIHQDAHTTEDEVADALRDIAAGRDLLTRLRSQAVRDINDDAEHKAREAAQ